MPNEELREKNTKEVLNQAIKCFIELGVEASTLSLIASRAGVTTRSILRYYQTKDNLVSQVIGAVLESMYAPMRAFMESAAFTQLDGLGQLMSVFDIRAKYAKEQPEYILCLTELEIYFTRHMRSADIYQRYSAGYQFVTDAVLKAFDKGIADGSVRLTVPVKEAAQFISVGYKGLLQRMSLIYANPVLIEVYNPDEMTRAFRDLVISSLKA